MRKKIVCVVLAAMMAVGMTGCGGSAKETGTSAKSDGKTAEKTEEETQEEKDQKEIRGWLDDTEKAIADARKYEVKTEYTNTFDSGKSNTNHSWYFYDLSNNLVEEKNQNEDSEVFSMFYQKDGDTIYDFQEINGVWYRYPKEEDQKVYFEDVFEVHDFYNETNYSDVVFQNEGEEDLDGVTYIKVTVTGYHLVRANTYERGGFLEERGITEEQVAAIEGYSEAVDQYIETYNNLYKDGGKIAFTDTLYFDKETHLLSVDEEEEAADTTLEGKEAEGKAQVEAEKAFWEKQEEYLRSQGMIDEGNEGTDYGNIVSWANKTTYLIGDKMEASDPFPEGATDVTFDQITSGELYN